jgi:hypothetical protein
MLIESSSFTPPCGTNYSFLLNALGNTFPGIDVSLLVCTTSILLSLDVATKIWRRRSVEIDIAPSGVVIQYRANLDRRDTGQQQVQLPGRYVSSRRSSTSSESIEVEITRTTSSLDPRWQHIQSSRMMEPSHPLSTGRRLQYHSV